MRIHTGARVGLRSRYTSEGSNQRDFSSSLPGCFFATVEEDEARQSKHFALDFCAVLL